MITGTSAHDLRKYSLTLHCTKNSTSKERPAVAASSAICTASSSGGRPARAASAQDEELVEAFDTSSSYVVAEGAALGSSCTAHTCCYCTSKVA